MSYGEAVDRTVRLIKSDCFGNSLDGAVIERHLHSSRILIHSDEQNAMTPEGQTVIAALAGQLGMMGVRVVLSVPNVPLLSPQPPLSRGHLLDALIDYGNDLVPGAPFDTDVVNVDLSLVVGTTAATNFPALRLYGRSWCAGVADAGGTAGLPWPNTSTFAQLAACALAAAHVARFVVGKVQDASATKAVTYNYDWKRTIEVDLAFPGCHEPGVIDVGPVDFVSGGAITTAALYTLVRLPILGSFRVIEPELLDVSNLNRYALMRRSDCSLPKADVLRDRTATRFDVQPVKGRFDERSGASFEPLAGRVLVGVDDIPSRWLVQLRNPQWLCVGATSHFFAMTSHHSPSSPCAGCVHPRDEAGPDVIPTISFVSLWAGLLQARDLFARAMHRPLEPRTQYCYPLGINGSGILQRVSQAAIPNCPVQCEASRGG